MQILKPKFWSKKNTILSFLMLPFSFLFQILIKSKRIISKEKKFDIPIICIGNIFIGGTGKTPLSIFVAEELKKNNKKPSIIKKFYSNHKDEHELIKDKINCLYLARKRSDAIHQAMAAKCDLAILDDGFQDFSIKKDLNILCFNSKQLIGNGMTIPSGPLRESMSAIARADIVVINGEKSKFFENLIFNISKKTEIYYSKYIPININKFKNKKIFAFAGIGNPDNFFDILTQYNLNIKKKIPYSDHYEFTKKELNEILDFSLKNNLQPITTEKDYHRIKKFGFKNFDYLELKLEIFEKNKFFKKVDGCL